MSAHSTDVDDDVNVAQLVERLSEQLRRLVRAELALAKQEMAAQAKVVAVGVGTFGAGALLLLVGGACAIVAAILGLSNVMQPWLAAIVVGGGCVLLALLIVAPGWKGIRDRRPPVPHQTVDNLKADLAAVADGMHH